MADTLLPAAGWYSDGSTVGVHRWFDGTAWTEHTRPERDAFDPSASTALPSDSRFATDDAPAVGSVLPSRNGMAMSVADHEAREESFRKHRLADACRVRRGAIGAFCSGIALVVVTSGISLALQTPSELWIVGGLGAGFLVWRAARDYGRAVFRDAPRLSIVSWTVAIVGLVAAVGLFVSVPIEAVHHASAALDGVTDLTNLPGLGVPTDIPELTDPTG
ncbi:DUF2510 domain-containing protein [Cellulomonas sp. URHD0024]|uniref:DUF2510 domain-containing protein n=1 Tax=Cellulomonas sp. URHD0024 TaxID=1302620 RepID=UPI00041C7C9F|nr:DUF2510 domain-containing protein [Cellulomonas sp. URHD0024]